MKAFFLLVLVALAGCAKEAEPYHGVSESSQISQRDRLLLRRYRIVPLHPHQPLAPYLSVKEAFVEQRFIGYSNSDSIRLVATDHVESQMIVVLTKEPEIGVLTVNWNLLLADGVPIQNRHQVMPASMAPPTLLCLRLKPQPTFESPVFPMRLEFKKDSVWHYIDLKAEPLPQ